WREWEEGKRPKPQEPRREVMIPRTDEGAALPLIFGRVRVRQPFLAWSGDVQSELVDEETGRYRIIALDMLFAIGIGMGTGGTRGASRSGNKLHSVWLGDYKLPSYGQLPRVTGGTIFYGQMGARETLYGGPGRGGGLRGSFHWFGGWT